MKQITFAVGLLAITLLNPGCGGDSKKEATKNQSSNSKDPNKSSSTEKETNKNESKPQKVTSTLPFKDLDLAEAKKGIDPGRLVIDVSGKDADGKPLSLSDYKGKVILLDTWASW